MNQLTKEAAAFRAARGHPALLHLLRKHGFNRVDDVPDELHGSIIQALKKGVMFAATDGDKDPPKSIDEIDTAGVYARWNSAGKKRQPDDIDDEE